jgi:hypothetical protein
MTMSLEQFNSICERIKDGKKTGETDTRLGRVLAKWRDHEFPIQRDGKWLLEGFIMEAKRHREIYSAIDPTISPDLPPHLLDPVQIAHFWSIPLEEFSWSPNPVDGAEGNGSQRHEEFGEPPEEVGTARAAEVLGVSKDTVLKLKAAGLLEHRNIAPPGSSRPVYAFTLRSVMELRTSYERDEPHPRRQPESPNRRVKGHKKYKHLNLDD